MRRFILTAAAMLVLASPAWAQAPTLPQREAVVANDTDRSLQELFIFRPGDAQQGPDRLGPHVLPPRATLRVALGRTRDCAFELRAVLEGGDELRRRQDVCRNPRIALTDTGPRRDIAVVNQTDRVLRELYLVPPNGQDRERDRLGSSTVAAGETHHLRLRGMPGCVFDTRGVFADDAEEVRERQDICRTPRLVFGDAGIPLREVPVANRGRRTIRELYARAAGRTAWGADRLGAEVVEARGDFRLRLRSRDCRFDIRAVFEDDREEVQRDLDLCTTQGLGFGMAVAADAAPRRLILVNGFGRTVQQVFLSPAENTEWGQDALGNAVLAPGARQALTLESGCRADLRIVFDTSAAEERRGIDICATAIIALRPGWTIDDRLAPAEATSQPGGIRLRNAAALPVVALYADPPGATARGADRLGQTALGPGESLHFAPPGDLPAGAAHCQADLTAVFGDGRELLLPDIDLCTGQELLLQ